MSDIFTPYRICLLGAHVDHQKGETLSIAINKGIHLHYDYNLLAMIEAVNMNKEIYILKDLDKENHWSDYLKGSIAILRKHKGNLYNLIKGEIKGDFPIGGLSSSAAVIITYLRALAKVNNIELNSEELLNYAYEVEHDYLGLNIGKLDQSSIIYSKENNILHYDFYNNTKETKEFHFDGKILIVHSGLERCLLNCAYNNRVNEYKEIIDIYNQHNDTNYKYLREIDYNKLNLDLYNNTQIKRINHFYNEVNRVHKGLTLLNNVKDFGKLVNESCESSILNYESGCEQLIYLYKLLSDSQYVYGTRFNGAGFKGSLYALIKNDKAIEVIDKYKFKYPELDIKFNIVNSVNGINHL